MDYKDLEKSKKEECKIEIYNLRKQGLTYEKIVKQLEKQGIKISLSTVGGICKEIYALKGEIDPKAEKNININEEIYRLRENRLTYTEIVNELEKQGIKVCYGTVRQRSIEIYASKGKIEPKAEKNININEEIYRLRENRLTYTEIVNELEKQGIKLSYASVRKKCKEIYALKGKIEPKAEKNININEEIYRLREDRLTYTEIVNELEKQGIKVCYETVRQRSKEIYASKGKIAPKAEKNININEEIYRLRENRLTYTEIVNELEKQGIKLSYAIVRKKCKGIYASKRKIELMTYGNKDKERQELNKRINTLKEEGLTYQEISDRLKEKGITLSRQRAEQRHKDFLKLSNQQLAKAILNLIITRKATMEQIQQIADYYGVDLEKTMNSLEEPNHSLDER